MPNVRLILEYDGSAYHGWQRQRNVPTIQQAIEQAIKRITHESVTVIGAGRTDAGTHALAQVANFHTTSDLDATTWRRALNAVLPGDIAVTEAEWTQDSFHARFAARGKHYRYLILNRSSSSPLFRGVCWHVAAPLSASRMRQAAVRLLGRHDFRGFQAADPTHDPSASTICDVARCAVRRTGDRITIDLEADRFLKYMVRNIVGTLREIGHRKRDPNDISAILTSGDRRLAGPTAPARGLTLVEVRY